MTMDAVTVETLPTTKSLLSTKVPESTDITKEKHDDGILFVDEIDEDDEIRLRLSDDEEVEQDNTLGHAESQQENLQLKRNDIEFDVRIAVTSKDTSKIHHKELIIKQDLPDADTLTLIKNESTENSFDEKFVNEICNINDEESIMSGNEKIPQLTQNSRKFWSNNFDKRWKGINSSRGRQNFCHRNSNDWYNHQYSDKDKLNNRNNFNHHNNHFNKLRNNTRGNCNSYSGENRNKEVKKELDESLMLKHSISSSKNVNDINHSTQENGISNDTWSKKKDFLFQNDKITGNSKVNNKETKNTEKDSNKKRDKETSSEEKLFDLEMCKENDNSNDISVNKDVKKIEKLMDNKISDINVSPITKDCYVSMTESEKENYKSKSDEVNKEIENKCNSDKTQKHISNDKDSILIDMKLESEQNSIEKSSELSSEIQLKIETIASHNDNILENKCQNVMEIDNNNENLSNGIDKNNSDQISVCGNAKEILELNENFQKEIKVDNQKCFDELEKQTEESCVQISNGDTNINSLEKPMIIGDTEISEIELKDNKNSQAANEKSNNIIDVVTDTESSQSIIAVTGVKNIDPNDLKLLLNKDQKNFVDKSLLELDKNNSSIEEKTITILNQENKEIGNQSKELKNLDQQEKFNLIESGEQEKINSIIEEVDLVDDETEIEVAPTFNDIQIENLKIKVDAINNSSTINKDISQIVPISTVNDNKVEESNEDGRAVVHKRRRRKRLSNVTYLEIATSEIQTDEFFNSVKMLIENGVRQKRRSARNAEEMIRKEILKNDEDEENSSDESGKLVTVNYKKANYAQPLSPPSLKRTLDDSDCISESVTLKRIKSSGDNTMTTIQSHEKKEQKEHVLKSKEIITETNELVRKISQEDLRGKLKKLKQEELEALLLQKIVECITIRGEMGKLREQARVSKRNQEATRTKCQQLQKQVEGFDMVLKRISYDKNSNNDKFAPPIKINRSVGLQVNFLSDHGIHNLKQIQAMKTSVGNVNTGLNISAAKTTLTSTTTSGASMTTIQDNRSATQSPRKMLKVRSPRRPELATPVLVQGSPGSTVTSTVNSNSITSTPLVVSKPVDQSPKRTVTLQNSNNVVQLIPPIQQQTVVVNSNITGASTRPTTLTIQRSNNSVTNKASDLIDLTDEEDKSKTSVITPISTGITTRFPRVLQAVPASVALTNPNSLRLVQAGSQGSQTSIVSNINSPRLAYVMQGGMSGVPTRQLVLASSNTIRPVTSVSTRNISTISYKQGVPTITNGSVRVLTTQTSTTNFQVTRHPAPLPESPIPDSNPMWKLPPPAPSLKISKVATGIVLSWNMSLSDKFAEIVSYQLYAYQEVAGTSPSAALWKKVGDVRALPLPMACTLTQFTEGNNYYFAVRAVDIHSRFGQYSKPGNISL